MKTAFLVLTALALSAATADADPTCKPVVGSFEAHVVSPPFGDCPGFCTEGRVWGGVQGTYHFTMTGLQSSIAVPSIFFFTGQSEVSVKNGDVVHGTDTGSLDFGPDAGFASLITFSGGTGAYQNATGQIRLRGLLNQVEGITSGDYVGTICTP